MSAMSILTESDSLYITDKEIMEALEISQPTLWRKTKKDNFPEPVIRGRRARKAVLDWLKAKGMM